MKTPSPVPPAHTHAKAPTGKSGFMLLVSILLIVLVLVIIFGSFSSCRNARKLEKAEALVALAEKRRAVESTNALPLPGKTNTPSPLQTPLRLTTPVTLPLDFDFNIESDGKPIKITYSDGSSFVYKAEGLQKFPVPPVGPKTFTDPGNPTNHVSFRIYRVQR